MLNTTVRTLTQNTMMLLACYRRDPNSPCRNALSEITVIKQTTSPLVCVRKKGYRQEQKCISLMAILDSDVLPVNRKISILRLLRFLTPGINKIMLLVSVDSVAGDLSFHAGEQGSDCSVKM